MSTLTAMQILRRTPVAALMLVMMAIPYGSPLVCNANGRVAPPVHNEECQQHTPDDMQSAPDCEHSACCAATIAIAATEVQLTPDIVQRVHYAPTVAQGWDGPPPNLPTPPPKS